MTIERASSLDLDTVKHITDRTTNAVYPRYYPDGAVRFFLEHHSAEHISEDIERDAVYICSCDGVPVGTVTLKGSAISRLFVLPEHQGKGCGRALLDFAEREIMAIHDSVLVDASLPAKAIYIKRGYIPTGFHVIQTANGDYLCYDVMERRG